jgi:hypothetical protein
VVAILGVAGLVLQLALDELPGLLTHTVALVAPGFELSVGTARLGVGRLDLRDVQVRAHGEPIPLLAAPRVVVRFSPWELRLGRIDEVRLAEPVISLPATVSALFHSDHERRSTRTWSIGRLATANGQFSMVPSSEHPGLSCGFALDLHELGLEPERAERMHHIALRNVGATLANDTTVLDARAAGISFSLAGVLERKRIEEIGLETPRVSLPATLPTFAGAGGESSTPAWSLGRLVTKHGSFSKPPSADTPGVAFGFAADLRELGLDPERSQEPHRLALQDVRVTLADNDATITVAAVRAGFRVAGLHERLIDEIRLFTPVVSVGEHIPDLSGTAHAGAGSPEWTIGRLATHDGRLQMAASEDVPGVVAGFAFDLRAVGAGSDESARPQHVRLHNLKVRPRQRPTWLVVDDARVDFTFRGLLQERQLARVALERGTLVVDSALRDRLSGTKGGPAPRLGAAVWSVTKLDIGELGVRLAELGPQIPDVTLEVHTRLHDVPLSPHGLARARTPQRIELADFSLYSPLDPFRKVVHIGSMFVEFTMADVFDRQLTSILVLSPTIYLGEDLIWYMNASRGGASGDQHGRPWTVRMLRAEFGRLVLTFKGVDRVGLPLGFRTDASNVTLGDLASLRLGAALRVPRQSYDFPGLDLTLRGVEGELRFDYPPGNVKDNVVNTLHVEEIRWRNYSVRNNWLAATFDANGVSGNLGGGAYSGYVNGGATLPFTSGPVTGWIAATDLDLAPIGEAVAGKHAEITGLADLSATADVLGGRLDRAHGILTLDRPGRVTFPGIDALVDRLPRDAPSWQRDLARIAVETLREYPYTRGDGWLEFADYRGEARLSLDGERGSRRIEIHYDQELPAVTSATGATE